MAKCLKNNSTGEIKRFAEKTRKEIWEIQEKVNSNNWNFCPKKEWKEVNKKEEQEKKKNEKKKTNKKKKSKEVEN